MMSTQPRFDEDTTLRLERIHINDIVPGKQQSTAAKPSPTLSRAPNTVGLPYRNGLPNHNVQLGYNNNQTDSDDDFPLPPPPLNAAMMNQVFSTQPANYSPPPPVSVSQPHGGPNVTYYPPPPGTISQVQSRPMGEVINSRPVMEHQGPTQSKPNTNYSPRNVDNQPIYQNLPPPRQVPERQQNPSHQVPTSLYPSRSSLESSPYRYDPSQSTLSLSPPGHTSPRPIHHPINNYTSAPAQGSPQLYSNHPGQFGSPPAAGGPRHPGQNYPPPGGHSPYYSSPAGQQTVSSPREQHQPKITPVSNIHYHAPPGGHVADGFPQGHPQSPVRAPSHMHPHGPGHLPSQGHPPVQGHLQSLGHPIVQGHPQSQGHPPVQGHPQSQGHPLVQGHAESQVHPQVHGHLQDHGQLQDRPQSPGIFPSASPSGVHSPVTQANSVPLQPMPATLTRTVPTAHHINITYRAGDPPVPAGKKSADKAKKEAEVDALTNLLIKNLESSSDPDFCGVCYKCGDAIVGEDAGCTALDQSYHVACFTCTDCKGFLRGKPFFSLEGKPFCEECYLNTLEKCCVCSKPITDRILRATGKPYHPLCFTCVVCGQSLDGVPFTVDATNQIHCIEDFHKKFAPRCCVCRLPILPEPGLEETVRIVALDRSFHVKCYKCEDCGILLSSEAEGCGCYPLDDHILCKSCNAKRIQAITSKIGSEL